MAKNLRAKIPREDALLICDSNADVTAKFIKEASSAAEGKELEVKVSRDPREVAEKCVGSCFFTFYACSPCLNDEHVLSMIYVGSLALFS